MCKRKLIISFVVLGLLSLGAMAPALLNPSGAQAALAPETFADLAQKASPAVVNISTEKKMKTDKTHERMREFFGQKPGQPSPFGQDDPFREFFEKFFGDIPKSFKSRSLGSGFIIDAGGLIITNNHVVEGSDKIKVKLDGGREYEATIKGRDPKTDLALIQITNPPKDLPFLALGNSDSVRVGDWVLAVGNPFGLSHTVTQGIISAKGRVIGAGPYDNFLQTDASINPGNSGGPLLNLKGEVVGINTAILASGQGIGFATPSNIAKSVIPQLREKGKVTRGMIGVQVQNVTPELAKSFGMSEPKGALVAEVNPDTPAAKAGIQREDIIIEFNGHPIHEMNELPRMVAETAPGTQATVKVLRQGKEKTFKLNITELKDERPAKAAGGGEEDHSPLGLKVKDLDSNLAQRLQLKESKGVVVMQVESGSAAADAGFRPGDLIEEINGQKVASVKDYLKTVTQLKKGTVARFYIKRQGKNLYLTVEIPQS
ncbi:MAG: DegQ family serine endoprotease [Deltaproteobacteria bacterium]|nr:MAG: DegQ family serine endoprotease [Deltaproteobacteria bacterium]